jgi:hypothetical protein
MPRFFLLTNALTGFALLLGFAAIPLAVRGVSPRIWRIHAAAAIALSLVQTGFAYLEIFGRMVPWWQLGAVYFAVSCLPVLAAGWGARNAARRWPGRRRLAAGLAGLLALVCVAVAAAGVTNGLLPDLIIAEQ